MVGSVLPYMSNAEKETWREKADLRTLDENKDLLQLLNICYINLLHQFSKCSSCVFRVTYPWILQDNNC